MTLCEPKRGEVWWLAFDLSVGGEVRKTRPAIIVSNDAANKVLNRVQVIPITSSVSRLYPAEAYVSVNNQRCKAMADQLTTASKERLRQRIDMLGHDDLKAVERAIRTQLAL